MRIFLIFISFLLVPTHSASSSRQDGGAEPNIHHLISFNFSESDMTLYDLQIFSGYVAEPGSIGGTIKIIDSYDSMNLSELHTKSWAIASYYGLYAYASSNKGGPSDIVFATGDPFHYATNNSGLKVGKRVAYLQLITSPEKKEYKTIATGTVEIKTLEKAWYHRPLKKFLNGK